MEKRMKTKKVKEEDFGWIPDKLNVQTCLNCPKSECTGSRCELLIRPKRRARNGK